MALLLAALIPNLALAAPIAVTVKDKGVKTLCAEEDNVYATLSAPGVKSFEVAARHPIYGPSLKSNASKPNFRHCKITPAKDYKSQPRNEVLFMGAKVMIKAITYPSYWRKQDVQVNVKGGRQDHGFHIVQVWVLVKGVWQEALVLHAADGYWRLRPLPMPQFDIAVYGTSFLIGPVEEEGRPFVRIASLDIDPEALTLTAHFEKGGQAKVSIVNLDTNELRAKVELDPPVATDGPFVALRSMYVAQDNADTAELHWTAADGLNQVDPVIGFGQVQASAVGFERSAPSKHNVSAPDILFDKFQN
jgi:hypothetical protein